jgi:hypothetical protein
MSLMSSAPKMASFVKLSFNMGQREETVCVSLDSRTAFVGRSAVTFAISWDHNV